MEDSNGGGSEKSAKKTKTIRDATPIRPRCTGKENETPSVASTGSRSAKAKAQERLHGLSDDIALYEKEKKRHAKGGNTIWGGKRAADQAEKTNTKTKQEEKPEDEDADALAKRPIKKTKPSLPDIQMRVVLTGFTRWVGDKNKEDQDRVRKREPFV